MSWKYIKFNIDNSVGNIILDNPEKNNALNISMRYELTEILHACELDNQIKLVIISSSAYTWILGLIVAATPVISIIIHIRISISIWIRIIHIPIQAPLHRAQEYHTPSL